MRQVRWLVRVVVFFFVPIVFFCPDALAFYSGKIAFVHEVSMYDPETGMEIYTMDINGENITPLTNNEFIDMDPKWSPDGQSLSFYSHREGDADIFMMDASGNNLVNVSNDPDNVYAEQSWSPDSQKIIAKKYLGGGSPDTSIVILDVAGGPAGEITPLTSSNRSPLWSPQGNRIAYDSLDAPARTYIMDTDGSNVVALPEGSQEYVWSPDGQTLLFYQDLKMWSVNPYGLDLSLVYEPTDGWLHANPVWSPDGSRIAFAETSSGAPYTSPSVIRLINADGTNVKTVSDIFLQPLQYLNWTSDGRYLVFSTMDESGEYQIYRFDLVSLELKQLTFEGNNIKPHVQPVAAASAAAVPEPATILMFGIGLLGAWGRARRK